MGIAMSDRFEIRTELPPSDIVYPVVRDALADASVSMDDIHSIVSCSQDIYDGRTISSMGVNEVLGGYLRSESKIAGDGLLALLYGAARIVSGEYDLTVVVAHCMESISDLHVVENAAFDPYVQRPLDPDNTVAAALQADAFYRASGLGPDDAAEVSAQASEHAARNPRAFRRTAPRPPTLRPARRSAGLCASSRAPRSRTAPARSFSPRPSGPATARSGCAGSATRPTRSGPTATFPLGDAPCAALRGRRHLAQAGLRVSDCEVVDDGRRAGRTSSSTRTSRRSGSTPTQTSIPPAASSAAARSTSSGSPGPPRQPSCCGATRRTHSCTRRADRQPAAHGRVPLPGAWVDARRRHRRHRPDRPQVAPRGRQHPGARREADVDRALEDGGVTFADIDAVCFGNMDLFEGLAENEHWLASAFGAVGKPLLKFNTGGTVGTSTTMGAFYLLKAGYYGRILAVVAAAPRPAARPLWRPSHTNRTYVRMVLRGQVPPKRLFRTGSGSQTWHLPRIGWQGLRGPQWTRLPPTDPHI